MFSRHPLGRLLSVLCTYGVRPFAWGYSRFTQTVIITGNNLGPPMIKKSIFEDYCSQL